MADAKRILMINDQSPPLEVRELLLQKRGYLVREISDPALTLAVAREFKPDLILVDYSRPGKGTLAILMLKGHALLRPIPIIYFSENKNIAALAAQSGAEAWLKKPFDISKLLELTDKFLKP
jgi:CheY-like chemotaxis protein